MDLPGMRYKILATRCRQSAESAGKPEERAALLRMARGYDRRASEIESEWDGQRRRATRQPEDLIP